MPPRSRRLGATAGSLILAAAVYSAVLLAGPFLHHNESCHARSGTHCPACHVSCSTAGAELARNPHVFVPPVFRPAVPEPESIPDWALRRSLNDRSPPA